MRAVPIYTTSWGTTVRRGHLPERGRALGEQRANHSSTTRLKTTTKIELRRAAGGFGVPGPPRFARAPRHHIGTIRARRSRAMCARWTETTNRDAVSQHEDVKQHDKVRAGRQSIG